MRKLILFALLLITAHLVAQTLPPQFSGLLTNSTDYTTSGSWTTPTIPSPGSSYTDSIFGIQANRIPSPTSCPTNSNYNPSGLCSITTTKLNVDYAKTVPWSVDDTYYVATDISGWVYLYSRSSEGVYTFIRWLQTWNTSYGSTRDYGMGQSLEGDFSNWNWANNASSSPHTIYYTGSSISNSNRFELKAYNADTDTITVVHDFTSTIATVNGWGTCAGTATSIDITRQGNQSDNDRYWAMNVTNGTSDVDCAVLVYDKAEDSVIALQTTAAGGICGTSACAYLVHALTVSPLGDYVIISWGSGGSRYDQNWVRGTGSEVWNNTLTYLGVASADDDHGDVGFDVNGLEVWVSQSSTQYGYGNYAFGMCNLANVNATPGVGGCRTYLSVPCSWSNSTCPVGGNIRSNGWFVSMRGSHGAAQGWMLLSTQTVGGSGALASTGNGGWGALENDAVLMNWSAGSTDVGSDGSVPPAASVVRVGRSHAILDYAIGSDDYESQVNAAPDRTFTKIAWTSNFDVAPLAACGGGTSYVGCNYYNMYTELGAGSVSSATQVTVSAAPSPATLGQSVTLTATVAQTGSSVPTGSINFLNGGVSLGQASLDNEGEATLVLSWLSVGSYNVIAAYSGDSNYATGESASVPLQVLSTTTASLTASPNPVSAGQTLTLTATLTGDGSVWPTGTVTFLNGSTLLGTGTLNSSGVASLSTTSLAAGTYSLTVRYGGDTNFLSSTSAAVSVTVNTQATTTSLTASPNPVATGQTLTLTAAVQGTGSTAPAGTVSFMSGSTLLGTATLNSSGVATLSTAALTAGTYSLTAQYAGNASFLSSTSAAVSVAVSSQATTTSLTASPNPVATGLTLTLTAAVQGTGSTTPGGTVNFLSGSTPLGTAPVNSSGIATLTITTLAVGSYSLTALYTGNANFLSSTSAAVSVTVYSQATTTSLTASPNPVATGQTLTLTAAVQGTGSTAPAGAVSFMSGSTLLGTATLNSSGVATLTTASLAAGTYSLTAQYSGNASFLSSSSAVVSVTVSSQATTTSLTASPNPVATGQTLTLTAAVEGTGSTAPGGTVSFMSGSTLLGTATLNSSGVATLTTTSLAAGTYSLRAQYSGSANFLSSTSAVVSVTVNAQATTTSLTASPNPVSAGQTLTLTATAQGAGSTTPAGAVSFMSGSTLLGTAPLNSSGVASLTITSLAAGTYILTAQYTGSASFLSSTSASISVTVNAQATATTTSLTASPNQIATGQTLTLTAAVQGTGSTVPAGTVSFMSGSTPLGTAPVNSSGAATLTITTLAVGSYSLTAQYSGNSSFLSSTSAAVSVTVSSQATTTTTSLTASPNPVATGQTLTLTAAVQGTGSIAPAGTVSFMSGSTPLGTAPVNSSGVATLTITTLAVGTYSLTAQYSGNAIFLSSTSAVVSATVSSQATTTTTTLTASPNPVATGQTLTLTAAVQGSGSTALGGTVSFMNGSALLGSATLNSSGVATLTTTSLAAETYSLTAQYSGYANFLSSTSAAVSVTVNAQTTTTDQAFSLNTTGSAPSQTVQPGNSAVYTLNVSPALGTTLPAITLTASGLPAGFTATFSPPTIAAGSGATNVTLSIQVPAQTATAMLERNRRLHAGLSVVAFCILLLPFGGRIRRSGKRMLPLSGVVLLLVAAASLVGLAGCTAPAGQFSSQSSQTYTITVTTTSASLSQTANVTLIVE